MPKNKVNNNIKLKSGGGLVNDASDGLSVENVSTLIAGEDIVSGEAIYLGSIPTTPISYDTSVGAKVSISTDPQVITQAITIADESDRYLVVSVFARGGNGSNGTPTVSSITYAGVALTLLVSSDTSKLYGLANPTVGTNNLIINTTKTGSTPYFGNVGYFAHSFYNCEYDDDFTGSGYTLATTLTVEGSIVVGSGVKYGFGAGTPYTSSSLSSNFLTVNAEAVNAYSGWQPTLGDITGTVNITTGAGIGAPDLALGVVLKPANLPTYGVARLTTTADPAYNGNRYLKFIGFSASDALEGESLDITTSGIVKSLSGLTPNSFYYLQDTAGKIDVSAGTNEKKVGIAISATELLLL